MSAVSIPEKVSLHQFLSNGKYGYIGESSSSQIGHRFNHTFHTTNPDTARINRKAILLDWVEVEEGMLWKDKHSVFYASPVVTRNPGESYEEYYARRDSFNECIAQMMAKHKNG